MPAPPARRDLRRLPKAHLHLHLTGSMRATTLLELADRQGRVLPEQLRRGDPLQVSADRRGWFRFQRLYDAARDCIRGREDMRRVVLEAAQDDAADGSGWLELQVDPTSYAGRAGGLSPALEVVLDAAREAGETTGCQVGIVVAASRLSHPYDARTLARLAARHAGDGGGDVVGFGLSNDERRGVTREFARAFDIARHAGLACVPHGGELLGAPHVELLLDTVRPDRLGHGVRAVEDPRVLRRIVDAGVGLEVCPSSNVGLGVYPDVAAVPVRALLAAGARVALGADDPLLFGARLTAQYELARDRHGLDDVALASLARTSIELSRAPTPVRSRLLGGVADWLRHPAGTAAETAAVGSTQGPAGATTG